MLPSQVGAVSESIVEADLLRKGYNVCYPKVPTRYDLLCEVGSDKFIRIQVKTAYITETGNLRVKYEMPYDASQVDVIAVYDPNHDALYYVPIEDIPTNARGFSLRITKRKYNRKSKMRGLTASKYIALPDIFEEENVCSF